MGLTAAATAQTPGTPTTKSTEPPPASTPAPELPALNEKAQKYLDAYLGAWEKRMTAIEGLETRLELTETDGKEKSVFRGSASILRPNYAQLFLKQVDDEANTKRWRHYIADGQYLWDYQYKAKKALVAKLPKDNIGENTLLSFMFGMKAADIKKRYHISVDPTNPDKFNDFYIHFTILPKTREDMQEFAKAELVLYKFNKPEDKENQKKFADYWMLPARLWFQHANKNQVTWEFKGLSTQKKLLARDFAAPAFPDKEWTREWAVNPNEKPLAPTAVRPTSK